jgi:hypothetical protein
MESRILEVTLPFGRNQADCDGTCSMFCLAAPAASALVRPAHELHGVFDMPPGSSQFDLAFCLEFDGVLSSFGNGLGAMCFQQLPCIVVDFDFSHGVILRSF